MKSIFMRNFLVFAGIVLISLTIFSLAFTSLSYSFVLGDKRETLGTTAMVVAVTASAKTTEASLDDWDLRMTVSSIARASGTHIIICDMAGRVVSCSDDEFICPHIGMTVPAGALNEIDSAETYNALNSLAGFYADIRYVSGTAVKSPYYTDETVGYVFVSVQSHEILEIWRAFTSIFFVAGLAVLFIAMAASLLLTGKQVAPLREMASAARRFAKGDFDARVKISRRDEIGELIEAFNLMADSIEKTEMNRREFVANVSHELKTPMTTISGFADGILDGTIPKERQDDYLRIIADETKRLSRLVRRMLEISRIQGVDPKVLLSSSFDITELARMAILRLEDRITQKNLDVDALIPEQALMVRGEEDAIMQVLYNILDNAVKFADAGTVLVLRIFKRSEKVFVSIKNTGETIPAGELPNIFSRFHKTDRSRSIDRDGVGLGLYIVKSIITGYGEDIYVKSDNRETEFVFSLTQK